MKDFFSKEFYGNNLGKWLLALGIILLSLIVARIIYWFCSKIVRIFTQKTKTKLDDILIDMVEEPMVVMIVIAGFWWATTILSFSSEIRQYINSGIILVTVLNIAWLITRTIDALIEEYIVPIVEKSENQLDDAILPIARKGIKLIFWFLAVIIGLNNAGYDVGTILAGLGIGGLAFAIGARSLVMNILGGVNILIIQPFKIGDRIQIAGHDGYVVGIGLSVTRIRTFLDEFVVAIPNKMFVDEEVVNVSAAKGTKASFDIHVATHISKAELAQLMQFLKDLVEASENTIKNLSSKHTVKAFSDFSIVIQFICYVEPQAPFWDVKSELAFEIMQYFKENDLRFAIRQGVGIPENNLALKV